MRRRHPNIPGTHPCQRGTCVFLAEKDQPFYCNACRRNDRHTPNCCRMPVPYQGAPAEGLLGTQFSARNAPATQSSGKDRPHPYIMENTDNRKRRRLSDDSSARVGLAGSGDLPESEDPHFSVCLGWSRDSQPVFAYLLWFEKFGTVFGDRAQKSWNVTESIFKTVASYQVDLCRPLQIHAYQKDVVPHTLQHIDVDTGIATTTISAGHLPMNQMTGCDLRIMAFLAGQESVAYALRLAILLVERLELSEIALTCQGARIDLWVAPAYSLSFFIQKPIWCFILVKREMLQKHQIGAGNLKKLTFTCCGLVDNCGMPYSDMDGEHIIE